MLSASFFSNPKTSFGLRRRDRIADAPFQGAFLFRFFFSLLPAIPSQALLRDHFFLEFVVFCAKMVPQRGPRGWPTNHVFHHFGHLGAQMPPRASTMAPGGGKVTKMVPKVSKIPPKWTPKTTKNECKKATNLNKGLLVRRCP